MDTLGPTLRFTLIRKGRVLYDGADLVPFVEDLDVELVDWGLSELRCTLNDPGHKLRDSNLFQLGDVVVVSLGWKGDTKIIDGFEIVERVTRFGTANDIPQLFLRGLPGPHVMMDVQGKIQAGDTIKDPYKGRRDRGGVMWGSEEKKVKPSYIVESVIGKYPFHVEIPKAVKKREPDMVVLQPRDVSDWELLQRIARFLGLTMFWRWDDDKKTWVLLWGKNPGDFQKRIYTFRYDARQETTLFSVDVEQIKVGQATQVEIMVWDNEDQVWKMVWAGNQDMGQVYTDDGAIKDNMLLQIRTSGFSVRTIAGKPFASVEEAIQTATSYLQEQQRHFWRLRAETVGLETLQPFQRHTVEGLGKEYDGDYRVVAVTHRFNKEGFWTTFEAYKILDAYYSTNVVRCHEGNCSGQ